MINANLPAAHAWNDAGCSVIPVRADGTKKPTGEWKQYQESRASSAQVASWFRNPDLGIAVVCGAVSGNLEMLELEGKATSSVHLDRIMEALINQDHVDALAFWTQLMDRGYMESTPSGGFHFLYRIEDHEVPGNTKIANRPPNADELADNPKCRSVTLAETRGEGGFVIVAPTAGTVHPTGDAWTVESGQIGVIPTVSWKTRCALHEAIAYALDEMPEQPVWQPVHRQNVTRPAGDLKPGEDFDLREDFGMLLSEYGWQYHSQGPAGSEFWTRPGKRVIDGHSASLYYEGSRNLFVWSSSTDLPLEKPISPFAFYTFMEHRGDFSAAGKALYRLGYGTRGSMGAVADDDDFWANTEDGTRTSVASADTPDGQVDPEPTRKVIRLSEWTETGVAELAAGLFHDQFQYVHEEEGFRVYGDGAWTRDKTSRTSYRIQQLTGHLREQAKENLDEATLTEDKEVIKDAKDLMTKANAFRSDRGHRACLSAFGRQPKVATSSDAFDADINLICLDNGTLDLSTMTLREHSPQDMLTLRVPVVYDAQAQCGEFEKTILECLPDPAVRAYFKRAVGYAFTGSPTAGAWFALNGDTGCGKSTVMNIILAAFGGHGRTAAQNTFVKRQDGSRAANDLNDIRNARIVAVMETAEGQQFNEALLKAYSGGDEMNSHGLYQENGVWKNRGVLFMLTNHPPRLSADDNANWRRIKMINFPNSQYDGTKTPDPDLANRIIRNELPGVLNWILEGVAEYREHGLGDPDQIVEAVKAHRVESDTVSQFLSEGTQDGYVTVAPEQSIASTQLYLIYTNWCSDFGIKPLGAQRFGMRLSALKYGQRKGAQGIRLRTGIGVGLRGAAGTIPWRN